MAVRAVARTSSERLAQALYWVLLLCLCFLSPNRGLWTPDEPREAEIGREMFTQPGFTPHLNAKPFFEKPPSTTGPCPPLTASLAGRPLLRPVR